MPGKEYTGVSMKNEIAENVENFIKAHPMLGYRTITQFVEDATRRRLEELQAEIKEPPRFEQVNSDEEGVKILDRKIHEVVQIYIKPSGIKCSFHQTDDCEHIQYALTIKEVADNIRKKKKQGWKNLPDI